MSSTSERKIFPKFSPYQQTMQDSSGLASLVAIFNYLGKDVNEYNELKLVEEYEKINNTTVYGNGTTPAGLVLLINSLNLGITASNTEYDTSTLKTTDGTDFTGVQKWLETCIADGKFVLLRWQSPNGYGWKTVIGFDNKGKVPYSYSPKSMMETEGDDYVIFAEPNDNYDHFQDGYTAHRASNVVRFWFNATNDGVITNKFEYVVIDPNINVNFTEGTIDKTIPAQPLTQIYLPLNAEGTCAGVPYGSTRDGKLYGYIVSGGGMWNRTDLPYTKITDFYNMGSEGSRILLKNYTVLQQTMSSSCGVCAVNSVLSYYGHEGAPFDLELEYTNAYDNHPGFSDVVRGGTSNGYHKMVLKDWGYDSHHYRTELGTGNKPVFANYDSFISFVKYNLLNDRPIVVLASPKGGHFITIIGYDDMGTDYIYDDVVIISDSADYWDGYQDGYNVHNANQFYRQFYNGSGTCMQQCLIIYKNK